jgi:predicted transcriptional regulator of viral defense system
VHVKREPSLAELVDGLQARGRYTFSREQAQAAVGRSPAAIRLAAARLARVGRLAMPRRGFFVIVPLEHRAAGAPPPSWYITDLLRDAGAAGYVGLLSAAALHGAAHQASQEYQVVVDKQLRAMTVGRSRLRFVFKRDAARTPVVSRKTETGSMSVSTVESTAFDLVQYVDVVGSIDTAASVLAELGNSVDEVALAECAAHFARSTGQRVGWLLDRVGHADKTQRLHDTLATRRPAAVSLRPGIAARSPADARWLIRVDRDVEIDE